MPPRPKIAPVPTFQQPPSRPPDPPATEGPPLTERPPAMSDPTKLLPMVPGNGAGAGGAPDVELPTRRRVGPPRTDTSDTPEDDIAPDPAVVAATLAAVLGIAVTAAALLVRRARPHRRLRRPSELQLRRFAKPISRILLRRVSLTMLNKDLVDVLAAAGVAGAYFEEGPLTIPQESAPAPREDEAP
jgi:hypothetical protein